MGGFRLGTWFGLEIRIDGSWLIIFTLVLWSFTVGVFPARAPGLSPGTYLMMGFSGSILFFLSVLLHEISHSLVAESRGIPVDGITLFVFGGMAHTRTEFETPGDEFVIAAAGPLASFGIAGVLWGVSAAAPAIGAGRGIVAVMSYLALLNLILGLFNLLPGFPLDGGRIFRAAIWKVSGDLTRATRLAALGGRVLGYGLIGIGILQVLAGAPIGGLWMVFIGWFVRMAADSSYRQQQLRSRLAGRTVREVMTTEVQAIAADATLQEFMDSFLFRGRSDRYPVVEEGRPVGMLAFDDVREVATAEWTSRSVREAMKPIRSETLIEASLPVEEGVERVRGASDGWLLVIDDGRLVGVLSAEDVSRWLRRSSMLGETEG